MSTNEITPEIQKFMDAATELHQGAGMGAPDWLKELREQATQSFISLGFPTPANEDWKYTSLSHLVKKGFAPYCSGDASISPEFLETCLLDKCWVRLVFVNGFYRPDLSGSLEGKGVTVKSLAEAVAEGSEVTEKHLGKIAISGYNGVVALNGALAEDGSLVHIEKDAELDAPVFLLHLVSGPVEGAAFPRHLLVADPNSRATVIEAFASPFAGSYWSNCVTEVLVDEGAEVDYYRLQQEGPGGFHTSLVQARQEKDSVFSITTVNLGGVLVRNDVNIYLNGEGCVANLNGLSLVDGTRHVDNHTALDHAQAHCESHELYKAILDGKSRSVFNGKIYVHKDAQKTDAKQTNKNLLLSPDAKVDTKPQLEIFADDVKCTHGATVGQLADQELFYLQSRGLTQDAAKRLLMFGFANDIVERIKPHALRHYLEHLLTETFHAPIEVEGV